MLHELSQLMPTTSLYEANLNVEVSEWIQAAPPA